MALGYVTTSGRRARATSVGFITHYLILLKSASVPLRMEEPIEPTISKLRANKSTRAGRAPRGSSHFISLIPSKVTRPVTKPLSYKYRLEYTVRFAGVGRCVMAALTAGYVIIDSGNIYHRQTISLSGRPTTPSSLN